MNQLRSRIRPKRPVTFRFVIAALITASMVTGGLVFSGFLGQTLRVTLPELPPVWELYPDVYDKDGCLQVPADEGGGRRCGPPAMVFPIDHSPETHRVLKGFIGRYYASLVNGNAVTVLQESLTIADSGTWRAWGLVRNETMRNVGNVTVSATLFGRDGTLLDRVSAKVPVSVLRPGEPGPFTIRSTISVSDVARVEWSVEPGALNPAVSRDFIVQPFWEVPFGVSEWRGVKRNDSPYPYVLSAGFTNLGSRIQRATLVVAWLDENNRVVWVETAPLAPGTGASIPPDGSANFVEIRVSDSAVGPRLYDYTKMYWVVGE